MELRDLEIFLTLAKELHFGRTAERLHVTQARVSQSIKKQERRIGAALFDRSSRRVRLTPIGQQLYDDLQPIHRALLEGLSRARLAAQGKTSVLRIGMISWNLPDLQPVFDAFTVAQPDCDLQIRTINFGDPFGGLRGGEIDIALLWLPVREPDLTVGPLAWTEPIVLAVSARHPLARRESISLEDLAGQTVMGGATPDYWREALVPRRTPSGRPIPIGPIVTNSEQMIPILRTGEAMSPVHAQAARHYVPPGGDIAYVPIRDAPLGRWAPVWRTAAETHLIRAFANVVRDVGPLDL